VARLEQGLRQAQQALEPLRVLLLRVHLTSCFLSLWKIFLISGATRDRAGSNRSAQK
jgi:hypothetical protein